MGNRLVISVEVNGEKRFDMYWHWGADCAHEFYQKCRLLSILDKDDDLFTMLGKVCNNYPKAGLLDKQYWFSDFGKNESEKFMSETDKIRWMHQEGIPLCEDRNEGLITFTPIAMAEMEAWAEWVSELDLADPDFSILDCLWIAEDPEDYADEEVWDMPDFMKAMATKENALELSHKVYLIGDGYYRDKATNIVYQMC